MHSCRFIEVAKKQYVTKLSREILKVGFFENPEECVLLMKNDNNKPPNI